MKSRANRIHNEKDVADYLAQQERELNDEDFVDDEPYYTFLVCLTAKERTGSLMFDTLSCDVEARSARDAVAIAILQFQHEYDPDEGIDDPTEW